MSDTTYIFDHPQDDDTFGGRLSRARDAAGLSSRDLASRLSVKIATVDAWERDRSAPSARRITTMAGIMGVSLSWLLEGIGPAPSATDETAPAAADEKLTDLLADLKQLKADVAGVIGRVEQQIGAR
ncbi:MAG: helix-turn-helix domain-containing protein [Mesorhizobium sp.]